MGLAAAAALAVGLAAQAPPQNPPGTPPQTGAQSPKQPPAQAPPQGQAKPETPPQRPTFRVATNFVQVDAYPTAGGRPVTDLKQNEFEIFEDGKPQTIESFEHVVARAPAPEELRVEPTSVEAANQAAADPSNRIFVVFLDTYHVEGEAAKNVRQPLVNFLNKLIGQDDLVAVMTPEMAPTDMTFTRRMGSIEAILDKGWDWGRRSQLTQRDPQEQLYEICFPPDPGVPWQDTLAGQMIERRREKLTFDALHDLVFHLEGLREGRKAVLTVTDGWRLFREDRSLMSSAPPQTPGVYVGPGGKLGVGNDPRYGVGDTQMACDRDRTMLAMLDDDSTFRVLLDDANRANVSFYPVDPRGLPVFDTPIGPSAPIGAVRDQAQLRGRIESLQTMAVDTDGIAVVNSNDIDRGLRRIVEDLTSYYLLGYSSTNSKPDGRYRKITVRVKRPGVDVRARRGYRAPSEADVAARNAAAASSGGPPSEADLAAATVSSALGALSLVRPNVPVRFSTGYLWRSAEGAAGGQAAGSGAALWVTGELDAGRTGDVGWREGGEAAITATGPGNRAVGTATGQLTRTIRGFRVILPADARLEPGVYDLRISPKSSTGSPAPTEAFKVTVPAAPSGADQLLLGQPGLLRRGPYTGTTFQAVADPRFRRTEWIRVEVSKAGASEDVTGRLLDRTGKALDVPVKVGERADGGITWIQGEVVLAPLTAGDYLIELGVRGKNATERVLVAFRIVP